MSVLTLGQWLYCATVIAKFSCGFGRGVRSHKLQAPDGGIPEHDPDDVPLNGGKPAGTVEFCGEPGDFLGPRPIWNDVGEKFVEAQVLNQLESKHVIMVLPVVPIQDGGEIIAQAFKALPRKPVNYLTSLTKVVLVGHSYVDGNDGITVGAEACRADLVDKKAADWFKKNTMNPMVLSRIDNANCCPTKVNPTIDQQMPYLSMIFDEPDPKDSTKKARTVKGNLLPIMIQKQSVDIGNALGEALTSLIGPSGIWNKERVLFVFTSDMSHGIKKKFALPIDKDIVAAITNQGFGPTVNKINKVKAGDQNPGAPTDFITKAPYGYSCVLAATKLAENLKYRGSPMAVTSSGAYEGKILTNALDPVRGYATIVWVGDARTAGEIEGAKPKSQTYAPTTTTTITLLNHPGDQQHSETVTDQPKFVGAAPGLQKFML